MKKWWIVLLACALLAVLTACGGNETSSVPSESVVESAAESPAPTEAPASSASEESSEVSEESEAEPVIEESEIHETAPIGTVDNTLAQDESALVNTYAGAFQQIDYADADTGLSVTCNLFLPQGYDESQQYPLVVFIADSSCAGRGAEASLTQGLGALVWATEEWQAVHPSIVLVPTYPETILDDHGSYTTTEYVELTKRLIDDFVQNYAVDESRVYGTGQSMGCMTHLILAAEYPDLYTACLFVDGQWDVNALTGLEDRSFVYFAAEDDANAFAGMSEVMEMFDADGVPYAYQQWDGNWTPDELSAAAKDLAARGRKANFISWETGTIDASGSGMGGASYHMASFDYAYNCVAVMEWLFQQTK